MERIKNILRSVFLVLLAFLIIASCSGAQIQKQETTGVYHRVKKGQTAYSIARAYNLKLQDLAQINNISDPALIKEGAVLFIPGAKHVIEDVMTYVKDIDTKVKSNGADKSVMPAEKIAEEKGKEILERKKDNEPDNKPEIKTALPDKDEPKKIEGQDEQKKDKSNERKSTIIEKTEPKTEEKSSEGEKEEIQSGKKIFIWPVSGTVKTRFGRQPNKTYHNWIKIVSNAGTSVKAAAAGTVIFSSSLKDYGQTVIIRHENQFTTVYTHLKERFVKADQDVRREQEIGLVGEKDESGAAYINFEIRIKGKASNPLLFLP
jgi:lipoprotein NlpD